MPITYIGGHNLTPGKGIDNSNRMWRVQAVKYGNLPMECAEIWNGHKRWFSFDDAEVREFYKKTNTKPVCDYAYLPDYPPHPGEAEWKYS